MVCLNYLFCKNMCTYLGWTRWLADLEFLKNKLPDLVTLNISTSSSDISGSSISFTSVKWGCSKLDSSECSGFSKLRFRILTSVPFWRFTSRFDFYYSKDQIFGLGMFNFAKKTRQIFYFIVFLIHMILLLCICIFKVHILTIPKW